MWGNKRGQRSPFTKKRPKMPTIKKEAKEPTKKWEKREKGQLLLSSFHTCASNSTMIFMIESLICCHFHFLVGNFHYITWLVYSNDGLPQNCPRSSWASKLDAHPLVLPLSFHILIALVHPLYGNPYSFTLISINGHLHSPSIHRVNVTISSFLSHNHHHTLFHI